MIAATQNQQFKLYTLNAKLISFEPLDQFDKKDPTVLIIFDFKDMDFIIYYDEQVLHMVQAAGK